jgi:hypothetical protein
MICIFCACYSYVVWWFSHSFFLGNKYHNNKKKLRKVVDEINITSMMRCRADLLGNLVITLWKVIDRPGVAGAVLQTVSLLIHWLGDGLWNYIFKAQSLPSCESKSPEILRGCSSPPPHPPPPTPPRTPPPPPPGGNVFFNFFGGIFFFDKKKPGGGGGIVQSGGASWGGSVINGATPSSFKWKLIISQSS